VPQGGLGLSGHDRIAQATQAIYSVSHGKLQF
jgi:hypothetical protein